MVKPIQLNVRISGELSRHVAMNTGDDGAYENTSEYVRDLIRRDKERSEEQAFERLKAELKIAFNQPETTYRRISAKKFLTNKLANKKAATAS